MEFGDVYTTIGPKGVVSAVGESYMRVDVPTSFVRLLAMSGGLKIDESWVFVTTPSDLPASNSSGVITLSDNITYVITKFVDLSGARIEMSHNNALIGGSSETCRLFSTGLSGSALLSSTHTTPIRNLSIESDIVFSLNGNGDLGQSVSLFDVKFTNCRQRGTISNYDSFSMFNSTVTSSNDLRLANSFNSIAIGDSQFNQRAAPGGNPLIRLSSSLSVTRSFEVVHSHFIVSSGSHGIAVDNEASITTNEGFVLDAVYFAGTGTALSGTNSQSNKAAISNCVGVENSADLAQYYMFNNATATALTNRYTFYKVAGTTTSGSYVRKFLLSNNRATYVGSRPGYYLITACMSFSTANNNEIAFRVAKDGAPIDSSETKATAGSSGRAESVTAQGVVFLSSGSYVEMFAANNTSANSTLTVSDLNMIIAKVST